MDASTALPSASAEHSEITLYFPSDNMIPSNPSASESQEIASYLLSEAITDTELEENSPHSAALTPPDSETDVTSDHFSRGSLVPELRGAESPLDEPTPLNEDDAIHLSQSMPITGDSQITGVQRSDGVVVFPSETSENDDKKDKDVVKQLPHAVVDSAQSVSSFALAEVLVEPLSVHAKTEPGEGNPVPLPIHENHPNPTLALQPNYPPIIYPVLHSDPIEDQMNVDPLPGTVNAPDEDGNDDDASSNVSEGENLRDDLESVLEGDFDFKGTYAYASPLPGAPNPCLHIAGLGVVGLPLSERDAKLIVGCSTQAPFGHGNQTVVDRQVRDTWEVEPTRVHFGNPGWVAFMDDMVKNVWQALGVAPYCSPPRCELYKLLLYETGSHFLPHQDTEKVTGMFATIIIILPSCYTGGQVHVSHSTSKQVIDFAPHSFSTTSVLAWYTDVVHEVKPITSGYRLALSYNLIHTSPGIPRPMLPNLHSAVSELRNVLRKWSKGTYSEGSDTKIIAYLLKHQYSEVNLKMAALKGEDAHKISYLRDVAADLGYMVCLANLSYNLSGVADDPGYGHYGGYRGRKQSRYDYDEDSDGDSDETDETPSMVEVTERSLSIDNLVDLVGIQILGVDELPLDEENLIPENPFEDIPPDETEYEGYMGNGAGSLEYWYRRTVLVLYHEDDELDILLSAGGVSYALQRIKRSDLGDPTSENKKMVDYILRNVTATARDRVTHCTLADYALQWKDVELWKRVVKASGADKDINVLGKQNILHACNTFSFDLIRDILEQILTRCPSLKARVDLIESLRVEPCNQYVAQWFSDQTTQALATLKTPTPEDVPILIAVTLAKGVSFIADVILPQLVKTNSTFDFWVAFIKALHSHKAFLSKPTQLDDSEHQKNSSVDRDPLENVFQQCFNAAIRQWDAVILQRQVYHSGHDAPKISRITQLIELCITTSNMVACARLFLLLTRSQGEPANKFQTLYIPLIPQLRQLLVKYSVDICSRPFGDFMRILIGLYLGIVLGAKPRYMRLDVRKIGCGCHECNSLDSFMLSSLTEHTFRLAQARRTHLELRLLKAADLITFHSIRSGTPHGLVVTKRPQLIAAMQWQTRQAQAKTFLSSIGNEAVIMKIMDSRYADVKKALDGTERFIMSMPNVDAGQPKTDAKASPSTDLPSQPSSLGPVPSIGLPSVTVGTSTLAGVKRKSPSETRKGDDDSVILKKKMDGAKKFVMGVLNSDVARSTGPARAAHPSQPSDMSSASVSRASMPSAKHTSTRLAHGSGKHGGMRRTRAVANKPTAGVPRSGVKSTSSSAHLPSAPVPGPSRPPPNDRTSALVGPKPKDGPRVFLGPVIDLTEDSP